MYHGGRLGINLYGQGEKQLLATGNCFFPDGSCFYEPVNNAIILFYEGFFILKMPIPSTGRYFNFVL